MYIDSLPMFLDDAPLLEEQLGRLGGKGSILPRFDCSNKVTSDVLDYGRVRARPGRLRRNLLDYGRVQKIVLGAY